MKKKAFPIQQNIKSCCVFCQKNFLYNKISNALSRTPKSLGNQARHIAYCNSGMSTRIGWAPQGTSARRQYGPKKMQPLQQRMSLPRFQTSLNKELATGRGQGVRSTRTALSHLRTKVMPSSIRNW